MDSVNQNKWGRPWSSVELKENAENWSLAGDVALLNTIKAFSEKLLNRSGEVSDKIDILLNNINEASLKLDLAQNEFQNLKNTQFIESRVYDDDEALDSKEEEKIVEKVISEDEQEKLIISSIKKGMEILDEYYDKLEVSLSDSEEETEKSNFCEYILKPKDMYAHRPLPPVIGTKEWYQKWHVDIPSSDSESDKVSDIYSESDSEDNLPKDFIKGSETSSELDFSSHASENRPVASSTFNSSQHVDLESSSLENEDQESLAEKTPVSNKSFAEQLAAKLGNIISEQEVVPEEINKRPIQASKISSVTGVPFEDEEPPPLDEFEESILPKNVQTGYFSGGQGLFDDDNGDDEPFWGQANKSPKFTHKQIPEEPKKHSFKEKKGLFDESSSDDDGMFTKAKIQTSESNKYLQPKAPTFGLYDEEPPELKDENNIPAAEKEKKPIGGVRLMGSVDIFNDKKISKILKGSSTENERIIKDTAKTDITQENFSKPKRKNLFDEDDLDDFLDLENQSKRLSKKENKKSHLFDDEITDDYLKTNDAANDINSSESHISKTTGTTANIKSSLFDDEEVVINKPKKVSLFDDDDELFNDDDFFSNMTNTKLSSKLFEDVEDKNDDMFNITYEQNKPKNVKKDLFNEDSEFEYAVDNKNVQNIVKNSNDFDDDKTVETEKTIENDLKLSGNTKTHKIKVDEPSTPDITNVIKEKNTSSDVLKADDIFLISEDIVSNIATSKLKTNDVMKKPVSLFEDSDSESDSMFSNNIKTGINRLESNDGDITDKIEENKDNKLENEENILPNQSENKVDISAKPETLPSTIIEEKNPETKMEKTANIPISIFDSVPPPDDGDDWDTKSDSLSDRDEYVPYQEQEDFSRSSVFDDEPPSLGPNESSGIVRDYSTNRTDADDSSFVPHASSSRRFSSDIFSDQQSQDSFFVTKNKTESANTASLGVIPEVTHGNLTDITPSGDIKDFDSTTESQTSKKTLLEEDGNSVENDEMLPFKRNISAKVESEKMLSRIAAFEQNLQNENSQLPPVEPKKSSPGKLKHNLNINVNALRPAMGHPKLRSLPKSQSLPNDETDSNVPEQENKLSSNFSSSNIPKIVTFSETGGTFDGNEGKVEVLQSITKDRAKIPVKRKPSTRRGRQEAIRRSAADLTFDYENYSENIDNMADDASSVDNNTVKKENLSEARSTISSTENSLDKENLSVEINKQIEIRSATITSTKAFNKTDRLLDNVSNDNEFVAESPKTVQSKITTSTKVIKTFFEDVNESSKINKTPDTKEKELLKESDVRTDTKPAQVVKRLTRLFDDDDLNDELFPTSNSTKIEKDADNTIKHSNVARLTGELGSPKKPITKLFTDSDDEIFSNLSWVKTKKETNEVTDSSNVVPSNLKSTKTSKLVPKLFNESDNEIFSSSSKAVKDEKKDTKVVEDKNIFQPVAENKNTNIRTSKLFNENNDETFESSKTIKFGKETDTVVKESHSPRPAAESRSANKKTTKLFNESDDEIFSSASKNVTKKKSARLFGSDDESDGELFQNAGAKGVGQKYSSSKSVFGKSQEHSKKFLFADSSSDDDLFSSSNKPVKNKVLPREPVLKTQKPHGFRKPENRETTEDPLSKLL